MVHRPITLKCFMFAIKLDGAVLFRRHAVVCTPLISGPAADRHQEILPTYRCLLDKMIYTAITDALRSREEKV